MYTIVNKFLFILSAMRSLLQLPRGGSLAKLMSLRSSRRAYLTFGHVRLRSCRCWGKKAGEKTPRLDRRRPRLDPRAPPSEILLLLPLQLAS
jgi:hypothetical protein